MIKKIYRLREREVKKVLRKAKPFFSYSIVLNSNQNKKGFNRFAIVIGTKSVNTNVSRNYFRRMFYDLIAKSYLFGEKYKNNKFYDFVFIVKKQTKLDKKDKKAIFNFNKDLSFLLNKFNTK